MKQLRIRCKSTKKKFEEQFAKFLNTFRKLHINISLLETISQVSIYVKFLKEILSKKRKLNEFETIALNKECHAILQHKLLPKLNYSESLKIHWSIGNNNTFNVLCDWGASINLIAFSVYRKLGLEELKDIIISLQLVDQPIVYP